MIEPRESAKNGVISGHGSNCIIFVNSELKSGIYDENCAEKKYFMSLRHF